MKRFRSFPFLVAGLLVGGALAGCDPAPSTPIAPDVPVPDTSKMSSEQIKELHGGGGGAASDRGSTPADRGG